MFARVKVQITAKLDDEQSRAFKSVNVPCRLAPVINTSEQENVPWMKLLPFYLPRAQKQSQTPRKLLSGMVTTYYTYTAKL